MFNAQKHFHLQGNSHGMNMLVSGAALLVAHVPAFIAFDMITFRQAMLRKSFHAKLRIIGSNSVSAIGSSTTRSLRRILCWPSRLAPNILSAQVYLPDGPCPFASYSSRGKGVR